MKHKIKFQGNNLVIGFAALVLIGGSFLVASGDVLSDPSSMVASVWAAISGKPMVLIGRDGASPRGVIQAGKSATLVIFDISAKNVTNWETLHHISLQAVITSAQFSPLSLSNVYASYRYCISAGQSYGYGWKSVGCTSIQITPSSVTRAGNAYIVSFDRDIPIYPQQSYGALSILGTPAYAYTGSASHALSGNATLQVKLVGGTASGDQCKSSSYGYKYGYSSCVSYPATVYIQSGSGNGLTVQRPYGYGYAVTSKR